MSVTDADMRRFVALRDKIQDLEREMAALRMKIEEQAGTSGRVIAGDWIAFVSKSAVERIVDKDTALRILKITCAQARTKGLLSRVIQTRIDVLHKDTLDDDIDDE